MTGKKARPAKSAFPQGEGGEAPPRKARAEGSGIKPEVLLRNIVGGIELCDNREGYPITYVSEGFLLLLGYTAQEFASLPQLHEALVFSEDVPSFREQMQRTPSAEAGERTAEYRVVRKDGSLIWVLDKAVHVSTGFGQDVLQRFLTDITVQKTAEDMLRKSEQRYEIAMGFSDVTMFNYEIATKRMINHPSDSERFNLPRVVENCPEALIERGVILPESADSMRAVYRQINHGAPRAETVVHALNREGAEVVLALRLVTLFSKEGKPLGAVGLKKDITRLVQLQRGKHFEDLMSQSVTVYEVNLTANRISSGHHRWGTLYGVVQTDDYEAMLRALQEKLLYPEDRGPYGAAFSRSRLLELFQTGQTSETLDYRRLEDNGSFAWVRCTMHLFEEPETGDVKAFAYVEKIDSEKKMELELRYKAQHDLLTGFYNKITLEEKVTAFLETPEGKSGRHVFFILDLDHFKEINDNFGHSFGDAVLAQVAAKLRVLFRDKDLLGRVGGDEFVIFMKNAEDQKSEGAKAREICGVVQELYTQNGKELRASTSVGMAVYPNHGSCYETLYEHSDTALYYAKEHGRNRFAAYDETMKKALSLPREIDENQLIETKTFDDYILEYIFRILYESSDKEAAINAVLALTGQFFNVSRAYVFEDTEDGRFTKNTFEWCNRGVTPQMAHLQRVAYETMEDYRGNFDKNGIFYMADIELQTEEIQRILEPQAVKSMLQFAVMREGKFLGFIGFDQCGFVRIPSQKELTDTRNIANVLGVFIMEMRAAQKGSRANQAVMSIVNGLHSYAYVCDAETHEVYFINRKTLEVAPKAQIGQPCYRAFWDRSEPCTVCPIKLLKGSRGENSSLEMYNTFLDIWVRASASWIKWVDGQQVCLVDSVDISEYKKLS